MKPDPPKADRRITVLDLVVCVTMFALVLGLLRAAAPLIWRYGDVTGRHDALALWLAFLGSLTLLGALLGAAVAFACYGRVAVTQGAYLGAMILPLPLAGLLFFMFVMFGG